MSDSHEWCRDVSRDEAIRAAEDAAAVPSIQHRDLPEVVAALTERVAKIEEAMMSGSTWYPICGIPAPPPPPAPPQPAPVPSSEGLRTERVTLEVTHAHEISAECWDWSRDLAPGESVRVVEEPAEIAFITAERDLARAARDGLRFQRDAARARVAELEAAPPPRGWLTAEERAAVADALVDYASNVGDHDCERIERVLRAILARSSPPRVKVPSRNVITATAGSRDIMWIAAIRAAGGEVEG